MDSINFSKKYYLLLLIIILVLSVLLRLFSLHPTFSDENVYYTMGKYVLLGKIPYKEFNFVHPPFQIYALAFLFKIFGVSLFSAKILALLASSLSVYLIFLISKKLFGDKVAIVSSLFFLLTTAFLAFSDQGYGMWESSFFVLLSFYFILKKKIELSAFVFSIAIFFRYLSLIYLPFLIIFIYLNNKKKTIRFLLTTILISFLILLLMFLIFGYEFIDDTIMFQFFARFTSYLPKQYFQYLSIGFFELFLGLLSGVIGYIKKDKILMLLSFYPLIINIAIFVVFKTIIYHYFLLSVPFLIIAVSKAFFAFEDKIVKAFILIVIILSIANNFTTIDFYINPKNSENIYYIADYIQNMTSKADNIFGESSIVDYISLTTNIQVTSSYLDSYLSYLIYKSEEKVINNLEKQKPKFIIDMEGYYISNPYFRNYLQSKYTLKKTVDGIPTYFIYERSV